MVIKGKGAEEGKTEGDEHERESHFYRVLKERES